MNKDFEWDECEYWKRRALKAEKELQETQEKIIKNAGFWDHYQETLAALKLLC